MASSRRTFDTDSITLRTVFAKNGNNTNIPALRVLTADGSGGTSWRLPSSFGTNPSFSQFVTSGGTFTADLSYNTFTLTAGQGMGMTSGGAGTNQLYLFAKAFSEIDVSGANTLKSFSNDTVTPSFKLAGTGGIQLRSDPARNIIYVDGPLTTTVSSGMYGFNRVRVIPSVSGISSNLSPSLGTILAANSPSTMLTFSGTGDLLLSTIYSTNQVFFNVSSYTAAGFLAISGEAFGLNTRLTSTIASLYVTKPDFSAATRVVSTNTYSNTSSLYSTLWGVSSYFATKFDILTGLINARATIVQLNTNVNRLTTAISSFSTNYIDYSDYISSTAGIIDQVSSVLFISGVSTLYIFGGTFYNFSTGALLYDQSDVSTLSTSVGGRICTTSNYFVLENAGNINSTFSTVAGLGTLGYISTPQLTSSMAGMGTLRYVSSPSLTSTTQGLGTLGYISAGQLLSTVAGLGTAGYFSTTFLNEALASTSKGIFDTMGSLRYISSASLASSIQSTTQGLFDYLGSSNYVSIASLNSTLQSTSRTINNNFGSFGYVSTATLNLALLSSVTGLGSLGYVSTATLDLGLTSTYTKITTFGYISTPNVISTVIGLGSAQYVSIASLVSTVSSLNFTVSTGLARPSFKSSLNYTVNWPGNVGYLVAETDPQYNFFFSTANFSLDTLSSYIQSTTSIVFEFQQFLTFGPAPGADGNASPFGPFSTIIDCAGTPVPNANYRDFVSFTNSNSCNLYQRTQTFTLPTQFVQAAYTSTYQLCHVIQKGYYNSGDMSYTGGFQGTGIFLGTAASNGAFVSILN